MNKKYSHDNDEIYEAEAEIIEESDIESVDGQGLEVYPDSDEVDDETPYVRYYEYRQGCGCPGCFTCGCMVFFFLLWLVLTMLFW
jgi:hypothetical protein